MSLHKLTAGDGYTYLTRQVAAADSTERGSLSLGEYYTEKGESPGRWVGAGLAGLGSVPAGSEVSEAQMLALFGHGHHPDTAAIVTRMVAAGAGPGEVGAATRLGTPFRVYEGSTEFRQRVAARFAAHNMGLGRGQRAPIADEVRARIRTDVGRRQFAKEYGRPPADGRELSGFVARGSRQATTAVAGYDLTFSPVKSVSALWAVAPRDIAEQVQAAHDAAVADVLGWLQTHAAYTRLGTNGVRQVDTTGLIGAAFTHRDSRAGDPDLHTHVAISNKVQTTGGPEGHQRWLALDGRVLHKAAVAASERYNTRLEAHLVDRLGVTFTERAGTAPAKRAVREIVGIEPALTGAWSSRRTSIETRRGELSSSFQAAHGRTPSPVEALALAQQATLETRDAKHEPRSPAEQRHAWRQQAVTILGGEQELAAMIHHTVPATTVNGTADVTETWVATTAATVTATVAGTRATWQEDHIRAEAERSARAAGIALARLDGAVDAVVTAALTAGSSVRLSAPEPVDGVEEPAALRRTDGTSMYTVARTQLFTSQAVLDAEARLLHAATRTDGRITIGSAVDLALLESVANGRELNPGQAGMVRELATSGARLQVALAPAGTGKTTSLAVLARAWSEDGGTVVGLAPTASAAAVLRTDLDAPTDTVDKLVHTVAAVNEAGNADSGVRVPQWVADIGPRTLVIIDEAAMVGTPNLDAAVSYILGRGGSVRLVGDDQQLASVSAGGVIRDIAATVDALTLSEVVRFADPAEGSASLAIRDADPAGLGYYLDHARVAVGDSATVVEQAYRAFKADAAAGLDTVMLAPTRELVAQLNERARTDRITATGGVVGAQAPLRGGSAASAGDVIATRRNDRRLVLTANDWVRNGDRWTVIDVVAGGAIRAQHLGTRRVITLPADYVATDVDLGYARTIHAAQGLTTDTAHTVVTGVESRQQLYVALTRGRAGNHVYVQTGTDGDPHSNITEEGVRPSTAVDVLTRMVAHDGTQSSATGTTRDLGDPTVVLGHAAGAYEDALGVAAESLVGPAVLAAIDTGANTIRPGLTGCRAYPTLRAHLAMIVLAGRDPVEALRCAAQSRELATAGDAAAVLDWRLDIAGQHCAGAGPLPWGPGIPKQFAAHPEWGPYLSARAAAVERAAQQVAEQAAAFTPTTAPGWARRLVGENPALVSRLAVWRAASKVDPTDRRPCGPDAQRIVVRRYQKRLDSEVAAVVGAPNTAATRWRPLAEAINPRLVTDPYWPFLAEKFTAAQRAGIDIANHAVTAATGRPLPDELPAAALWWRLSGQLAPAALEAKTDRTLLPTWAPVLVELLGAPLAQRVQADPAWPGLIAAVNHATHIGWSPEEVLSTAGEVLADAADGSPLRPAEVGTALVWRVETLLHAEQAVHAVGAEIPPEPPDEDERWVDPLDDEDYADDQDETITLGLESDDTDAYLAAVLEAGPEDAAELVGVEPTGDWDGALLTELPYSGLAPAEQLERIGADLVAVRAELQQALRALSAGTSPSVVATADTIAALRTRADELRPYAAVDADAHQAWIEADNTAEVAETVVADLARQLTQARTEGDTARVEGLTPVHASAQDELAYTRNQANRRRGEWRTAHERLYGAAGPAGIVTSDDVNFAQALATGIDVEALRPLREQLRTLESAQFRAENRATHHNARTTDDTVAHAEATARITTVHGDGTGLAARAASSTSVGARQTGLEHEIPEPAPGTVLRRTEHPQGPEDRWRAAMAPRPDDPLGAQRFDRAAAMVASYRSAYAVSSTDAARPLGLVPTDDKQAAAYRMVDTHWRNAMSTPTPTNSLASDEPGAVHGGVVEYTRDDTNLAQPVDQRDELRRGLDDATGSVRRARHNLEQARTKEADAETDGPSHTSGDEDYGYTERYGQGHDDGHRHSMGM